MHLRTTFRSSAAPSLSSVIVNSPTCQRECVSGLVSEYLHACKTIFCSMSDDKETNIYGLNHENSGVSWSYPVTSLENSIQLCGKLRQEDQKIKIFLDIPFFSHRGCAV